MANIKVNGNAEVTGELTLGGGVLKDFVVERGQNSLGRWIKWNSGWKEVFCYLQDEVQDVMNKICNFPIPFDNEPVLVTRTSRSINNTQVTYRMNAVSGITNTKAEYYTFNGITYTYIYACGF